MLGKKTIGIFLGAAISTIIMMMMTMMVTAIVVFAASPDIAYADSNYDFSLGSTNAVANPTTSDVFIDGKTVSFDAYNIDDYNYFKLRDIAYALNGTSKQFEVGWDEANDAISLTSSHPYSAVGDEMSNGGSGGKEATPTSSRIFLDGDEIQLTAYNIDGYNYFKLRDLGQAINFGVDWDESQNAIVINTGKGYATEESGSDQSDSVQSGSEQSGSVQANTERDYRSELVGYLWHKSDVLGSGWSERFLLAPENQFIYAASQMDGETRTRYISGVWEIEDGYLVLSFQKAIMWEGGETVPATGSIGTPMEIINANLVEKLYDPTEQHKILIGDFVYNADFPHPWSIYFETADQLFTGFWHRYDAQGDYDQLIEDWQELL
ncbi:MAG: copper amine oxidase N-terminal domain-containing protein [Oscillospiraceae bacterium]|nr:copper amine oxidase N-terminal domain-containing protein [Oscillospiraceae bacterium]